MKKNAVFGVVATHAAAEEVIAQVKRAGFDERDISALFPDEAKARSMLMSHHTQAPQGAIAGVGTGSVAGGAFGLLVGLGTLAVPGIGPLLAAGPLLAMLGGATVGAAIGGIAGALIGLGVPETHANRYAGKLRDGSILVSVHTDNTTELDRVRGIFESLNVTDIGVTPDPVAPRASRPSSPTPTAPMRGL